MMLKVLIVLAFVPIILRAMNPSQPLNKNDGAKSHRKSPRLLEMAAAAAAKKKLQQKLSPANKHQGNGGESISSSTKRDASLAMDRPQNELRPIDWADRSERHDSLLSLAEACAEFSLLLQSKESNSGKQNKSLDECGTNIGQTSNAHNQNDDNIGNIDEAIAAQRAQLDDLSLQSPSKKRKRPEMVETSKNAKEKSHELANASTHSKNNSRETGNLMNSHSPNFHNHKPPGDEQQNERIPKQITDSELQIDRNLQQPHSSEPLKAQSVQKSIGPEAPFDRNPQKSIGSEAPFDRNPQKSIGSEAPFDRNPQKSKGSDHRNDLKQEFQKSDELHTDQSQHSTKLMELDDKIKVHQQMTDQKQKHIIELDDDDDDEMEDLQQSTFNSDQPGPSKNQNIKLKSKSLQTSDPKVYYITDSDDDDLIPLDEHLRPLVQQNSKGKNVQMSDAEEDEMTVKPFNFDDDLLQLLSVQSLDEKIISQYYNKKSPNERGENQKNDRSPSTSRVQNPLVQYVNIQELNSLKKQVNSTPKPTSDKIQTSDSYKQQNANIMPMLELEKMQITDYNNKTAGAIPVAITEKKQKSDSNRQNANAMSISDHISMSTTFIGGSAETNRQMAPKKIEETIAAACATSVRAIGQTLNANVEGLINVITASKDNPKYTSNWVIAKILESTDNSLIKEIMMEILAEDNEFGEKMKHDLKQNNLLTDQQKEMHFLFTYVCLYRKFSNALKWGNLGDWTKISADQPKNEQTIVFLQWLNKLNRGLEQNLINHTNVPHYSNATEWIEKLGRLENAIELTNFGILLILSPDVWEMFGVERPTKVKGLFEKIGKQKIIKQFDANSDLSSIEQTAQKTWIILDKMGNNVVLEKIQNIFIKMIKQMKECNAVTLNIQNKPAKIILFNGILDQIYKELANSEFNQLYVPKLAEERANGLHFLEKCLEILNAEYESFEKGVQQELGDLAKLRKGYLKCATSKTTNPRGKSAKDPISLD